MEDTRKRILDATVAMYFERPIASITLDAVASRAEVSVQTVLRHFGSRAQLAEEAWAYGHEVVREERWAPVGDVDAAVRAVVDHYEQRGDGVLVLLGQEHDEELVQQMTAQGRRQHRAWVEETFAPFIAECADGDALVDLLVVATDVYTWKLLRRDRGLSRKRTQARMTQLVRALLA